MDGFRKLLREARKRAGLSQPKLAKKVEVDKSYISKLETGVFPPPSRDVTVGLADAVGMSNSPVTLYVSTKDIAALERFVFLLEANAAGAEDVQGIRLVEVEDGGAEEEDGQGSGAPTYSVLNEALGIPDSLLNTLRDQIKEITRLIDSLSLTDEEEEMVASQLDTTQRLLKFIAAQHNM